jgi:hypothetical protein
LKFIQFFLGWFDGAIFFFNLSSDKVDGFGVSMEEFVVVFIASSDSTLIPLVGLTVFGIVGSDKTMITEFVSAADY